MAITADVQKWVLAADQADLNELVELVKLRRGRLVVQAGMSFSPGDKVYFDAGHRGLVYGTIIKMNAKSAKVRAESTGMEWRVGPTLLRADTRAQKPAPIMAANPAKNDDPFPTELNHGI
jgi:hypothetical protein